MVRSGLSFIDRNVQETNLWLNEISEELGHTDGQVAYYALRGVLMALRDRLVPEDAIHLAAQFPELIRGIYFEGYTLTGKPESYTDRNTFLSRVSKELQNTGGANAERATHAVFRVLEKHVSKSELTQIREKLPDELRTLW